MIKIRIFNYQRYLKARNKRKREQMVRKKIVTCHITMMNLCMRKARKKIKKKKFRNKLDKTLKDLIWYEQYLQGLQKR